MQDVNAAVTGFEFYWTIGKNLCGRFAEHGAERDAEAFNQRGDGLADFGEN